MRKLILKLFKNFLYQKKNVNGMGVGIKMKGGKITGENCIIVTVRRKENVNNKNLIPKKLLGVKTDVIEVGNIEHIWRKEHRPLKMGASCCWVGLTACSAGLPLWDSENNPYLLMNKHCVAPLGAKVGDAVVNPSPADGGSVKKKIGEVTKYFFPEHYTRKDNIDYALVKLDKEMVMEDVEGNVYIPELAPVKEHQKITKGSRTTQDVRTSKGGIVSVDFEATVRSRADGKIYTYPNSILILNRDENDEALVMGGCSSSIGLINKRPVVQTYAGSSLAGIFNKVELTLKDIEKRFGLKLYLTKPEKQEGYIALGNWLSFNGTKITTRHFPNRARLRSKPQLGDTIIKTLPGGSNVEIKEFAGISNGYFWLKVLT